MFWALSLVLGCIKLLGWLVLWLLLLYLLQDRLLYMSNFADSKREVSPPARPIGPFLEACRLTLLRSHNRRGIRTTTPRVGGRPGGERRTRTHSW